MRSVEPRETERTTQGAMRRRFETRSDAETFQAKRKRDCATAFSEKPVE